MRVVPYIDPRYFKAPDLEWFNPSGFEFGIGYILHKSQDAKRRDEIRKLNERSY